MKKSKPTLAPTLQATGAGDAPFHRSGAVARMLRMPVATLRVWERRYALTRPELSPGGQRLYSVGDVRRLALLKQLTDLGHAIGSLAALNMAQLQQVAATHAHTLETTQTGARSGAGPLPPARAWRLAVIGAALGVRLQRPALLRRLARPVVVLGPFADLAQAAAALTAADLDALLIYEPQLQQDWPASLVAAAPAFAGVPKAVLYGFAADAVCEAVANTGTAVLRDPQPDAVVAQWLHSLSLVSMALAPLPNPITPATDAVLPRRWDDAALMDFAGRSSTVACECPRHVAELLVQLSHFETYSAACEQRSTADAAMHAYLRQVAAISRSRFEAALEHVALHEGLMLPSAAQRTEAAVRPAVPPRAR